MLESVLGVLDSSKYAIIFTASFLEGSVAMMTGGLLYRLQAVAFWPMFIALFVADILSDIMWYLLGYFGARRFFERYGRFVNVTPTIIDKVEAKFHQHHLRILVTSKLTMGFGFATAILATAGMLRISFLRFIIIDVLCGIVWVLALIGIGYYFGNILEHLPPLIKYGAVAGMVIVFFVAVRLISRYLAKTEWE